MLRICISLKRGSGLGIYELSSIDHAQEDVKFKKLHLKLLKQRKALKIPESNPARPNSRHFSSCYKMPNTDEQKYQDHTQCGGGQQLAVEMTPKQRIRPDPSTKCTSALKRLGDPEVSSILIDDNTQNYVVNYVEEIKGEPLVKIVSPLISINTTILSLGDVQKKLKTSTVYSYAIDLFSVSNYAKDLFDTPLGIVFLMSLHDKKEDQFSNSFKQSLQPSLILHGTYPKLHEGYKNAEDSPEYRQIRERINHEYELKHPKDKPDEGSSEADTEDGVSDRFSGEISSQATVPLICGNPSLIIPMQCISDLHELPKVHVVAGCGGNPGGDDDDDDDDSDDDDDTDRREKSPKNEDTSGPKRKKVEPDEDLPSCDGGDTPKLDNPISEDDHSRCGETHKESSNSEDQSIASDLAEKPVNSDPSDSPQENDATEGSLTCSDHDTGSTTHQTAGREVKGDDSEPSDSLQKVTLECKADSSAKETTQEEAGRKSKEVKHSNSSAEKHPSKEGTSHSGNASHQDGIDSSKALKPDKVEHKKEKEEEEEISQPSKSPLSTGQDPPDRKKRRFSPCPTVNPLHFLLTIFVFSFLVLSTYIAYTVPSNQSMLIEAQNAMIKAQSELMETHKALLLVQKTFMEAQNSKEAILFDELKQGLERHNTEHMRLNSLQRIPLPAMFGSGFLSSGLPSVKKSLTSKPSLSSPATVVNDRSITNETTILQPTKRKVEVNQCVLQQKTPLSIDHWFDSPPTLPQVVSLHSPTSPKQGSCPTATIITKEIAPESKEINSSSKFSSISQQNDKVSEWLIKDSTNNISGEYICRPREHQNYAMLNDITKLDLPVLNSTSDSTHCNPLQSLMSSKLTGRPAAANVKRQNKLACFTSRVSGPSSKNTEDIIQYQMVLVVIILSVITPIGHNPEIPKMLKFPKLRQLRAKRRSLKCGKLYRVVRRRAVSYAKCVQHVQPTHSTCKLKIVFTVTIFMSLISIANINYYSSIGEIAAPSPSQAAAKQLETVTCNSTTFTADVQQGVLPKALLCRPAAISDQQVESTKSMLQNSLVNRSAKCSESPPIQGCKVKKKDNPTLPWSNDTPNTETFGNQTCPFTSPLMPSGAGCDICKGNTVVVLVLEQKRTKVRKKTTSTACQLRNYRIHSWYFLPYSSELTSDTVPVVKQNQLVSLVSHFCEDHYCFLTCPSIFTASVIPSSDRREESAQDEIQDTVKKKDIFSLQQSITDKQQVKKVTFLCQHSDDGQVSKRSEIPTYFFNASMMPNCAGHDTRKINSFLVVIQEQNRTKVRKKDRYSLILTCSRLPYSEREEEPGKDQILSNVKKKNGVTDHKQEAKLYFDRMKQGTRWWQQCDDIQTAEPLGTLIFSFTAPLAASSIGHGTCIFKGHALVVLLLEQNRTKARKKDTLQLSGDEQSSMSCSSLLCRFKVSLSKTSLLTHRRNEQKKTATSQANLWSQSFSATNHQRNQLKDTFGPRDRIKDDHPQCSVPMSLTEIYPQMTNDSTILVQNGLNEKSFWNFGIKLVLIIIVILLPSVKNLRFRWYSLNFSMSEGIYSFVFDHDDGSVSEDIDSPNSEVNEPERSGSDISQDRRYSVGALQDNEERREEQETLSDQPTFVVVHGTAQHFIQPEATNQTSYSPPSALSTDRRRINLLHPPDLSARVSHSEHSHHNRDSGPLPQATNISYAIPDPSITNLGISSIGVLVEGEVGSALEQTSVADGENRDNQHPAYEPAHVLGLIRSIIMLVQYRCGCVCQILRSPSQELQNVNYTTMERIMQRMSVTAREVRRIRDWWNRCQSDFHREQRTLPLASHDRAQREHQFQREKYRICQLLLHHRHKLVRIERKLLRQLLRIRRHNVIDVPTPSHGSHHSTGSHSRNTEGGRTFVSLHANHRYSVGALQDNEERREEQETLSDQPTFVVVHGTAQHFIQPEATNQDSSGIQLSTLPFSSLIDEIAEHNSPPSALSTDRQRLNLLRPPDLSARISHSERSHHNRDSGPVPQATSISYAIPDPNITNLGISSIGVLEEGEVGAALEQTSVADGENRDNHHPAYEPAHVLGLIRSIIMLVQYRCDCVCHMLRSPSQELQNVNYTTMERIMQQMSFTAREVRRIRDWWNRCQSDFHREQRTLPLASNDRAQREHQFQREKYQIYQLLLHHYHKLVRIERKLLRQLLRIRRHNVIDVPTPSHGSHHSTGSHSPSTVNNRAPLIFQVQFEPHNSDLISST